MVYMEVVRSEVLRMLVELGIGVISQRCSQSGLLYFPNLTLM